MFHSNTRENREDQQRATAGRPARAARFGTLHHEALNHLAKLNSRKGGCAFRAQDDSLFRPDNWSEGSRKNITRAWKTSCQIMKGDGAPGFINSIGELFIILDIDQKPHL